MLGTQELRNKEVINIYDGKSLGFVYDIEINLEKGLIEGIVVPVQKSFFNFFGRKEDDYVIQWKDIKRIGDDVILVDVAGLLAMDGGERRRAVRAAGYGGFDQERTGEYGEAEAEHG